MLRLALRCTVTVAQDQEAEAPVIPFSKLASNNPPHAAKIRSRDLLSRRAKVYWTLGNLLMLVGVVVLLYVGGLYANAEFLRYAARGDNDLPVSVVIDDEVAAAPEVDEPAPFVAPILNQSAPANDGRVVGAIPAAIPAEHHSTVSRIVLPSINVDSKVIEVGWDVEKLATGEEAAVWQVAKYAVGQHRGSANPGEGGNVVLAGHVGGFGKVFRDLYYIKPGDQITLYSGDQQYLYTVKEHLVVTEEGVSPEQHAANAAYIAPTNQEVVTLVTCWPLTGPKKYSQRVIIRAVPFAPQLGADDAPISKWTIR